MNTNDLKTMALAAFCALGLSACMQDTAAIGTAAAHAPSTGSAQSPSGLGGPVDAAASARVRAALKRFDPAIEPEYIGNAPASGYQEVILGGEVLFVSNDGNYLARGLMDLRDRRDLAQFGALPLRRLEALKGIPVSERIVFAPAGARKHTVAVFTDVECGYCRKLHQDIAEYNRLGIAVEYMAFPRSGMGTADAAKMEAVWCADDRRKALTDAKNDVAVPMRHCVNPVSKHLAVGQHVGLRGTPMIINADGIALPGYLPPDKLLEALDRLAAQRKAQH